MCFKINRGLGVCDCASLTVERDTAERESRDKETKILNLSRQLDDLNERLAESERIRVQQQRELEDFISSKDDVGKKVRENFFMLFNN